MQDEYCEWDRNTAENGSLQCIFRTSFDKTRSHWLPERAGTNPLFAETVFNTYNDLVKIVSDCVGDPNNHVDINRVDPNDHTIPTSGAVVGNVDRISDPSICKFLHDYTFVYKRKLTPVPLPGPTPSIPGNPGIQIAVRSDLPPGCKFDVDPLLRAGILKDQSEEAITKFGLEERTYVTCTATDQTPDTSCDDFAQEMRVGIKLKVETQE